MKKEKEEHSRKSCDDGRPPVAPLAIIDPGDEIPVDKGDGGINVLAVLSTCLSAAICQLVGVLIGVYSAVSRDPSNDDRNGEIPHHLFELLG